jgi:hypothetical protein
MFLGKQKDKVGLGYKIHITLNESRKYITESISKLVLNPVSKNLIQFKKIIPVYTKNHMKPTDTKRRVTDY